MEAVVPDTIINNLKERFSEQISLDCSNLPAIYLKADAINQEMFEEADAERFRFKPQSGKNAGKEIAMSFWELPEELLDDPDALVNWLHASVDAAYRAKAGKSKKA